MLIWCRLIRMFRHNASPNLMIGCLLLAVSSQGAFADTPARYGMNSRPAAKAYLEMPERADGPMPARLSQTGAFRDLATLAPADSLIPYDINVSFWSDGAHKQRWVAVPNGP